ncbi:MAG: hypothetical protein WA432_00625 [Candidatus Babeliaceae bacterium]
MDWKEQLAFFEHAKKWDDAIFYMEHVIEQNHDSVDAYLSMNYLLMNLLVEEQHDCSKHDYYARLLKYYFDESYAKFSNNAAYLYYIARIASIFDWYLGIEFEDIHEMFKKALILDPDNLVYQWAYYGHDLDKNNPSDKDEILAYYKLVLQEDSPIQKELKERGALGKYILEIMQNTAQGVLAGEKY